MCFFVLNFTPKFKMTGRAILYTSLIDRLAFTQLGLPAYTLIRRLSHSKTKAEVNNQPIYRITCCDDVIRYLCRCLASLYQSRECIVGIPTAEL